MDRVSRASLWTLVAAALTAPGCADVLGFKDFADDADGGAASTGNPSGGQSPGGGTTNPSSSSNPGGGTGNPGGGSTGTSTSPSSGGTSGSTGGSGASGTGGSGGSGTGGGGGGTGSSSATTSGGGSSGGGTGTGASSSSSGPVSSGPVSSGPAPGCTYTSIPEPGGGSTSPSNSGSATEYYFGQCSGCFVGSTYKTACGYGGTETTSNGFNSVDVVPNAASMSPATDMYFAAIPGNSSPGSNATDYTTFNTVGACGACVELSANGKTIVATLIDECPIASNQPCAAAGHLDLSTTAFGALGYNQGGGGDPGGLSYQFVACPVSGNIKASLNSAGQVYFQNAVFPITSIMANGQSATLTVYGFWQFPGNASGANVTMTDVQGDTLTLTLPSIATWPTSTDIGAQFMKPTGTCP